MSRLKVGDRAYHARKNDPEGYEGHCTILEKIDEIHAKVLWEDSEQWSVVEFRHLMTVEEAEREGLI